MKQVVILICAVIFVTACGGKSSVKKSPTDVRPISHEVREVESTNSAETLLRATDKGSTVEFAITDAKKAAIWFLLQAGTKPLLKTKEDKRAIKNLEEKLS